MPASKPFREPTYRYHKARNCAVVTIDGRNHYLGKFGSEESREKYHRLVNEWLTRKTVTCPPPPPEDAGPTVDELILDYWDRHVVGYYLKDGRATSEQDNIRQALRFLRKSYGSTSARDFGPLALKAVRTSMIGAGRCRKLINKDVHRIRRLFKRAAAEEILPVAVHQALETVEALAKGRTQARETEKVKPVPVGVVERTLPFHSGPVAGMVQLQLLTGARPGEVTSLRPRDVDRSDPACWVYTPESHKTEHLDAERKIHIGPKAQVVLRPFLERAPDSYCFSPREAEEARNAAKRSSRRSPLTPSQRRRSERSEPSGRSTDRYNKDSYHRAIRRACDRAFPHPTISLVPEEERSDEQRVESETWRRSHRWHPHQLRHNAATEVRERFGIEAAQAVLGHSNISTTEIYTERSSKRAREAMSQVG